MPNPQSGTIGCQCGKCEITVADNRAVQYFRCGCEDCRQGIEWGESKKKEQTLYMQSNARPITPPLLHPS